MLPIINLSILFIEYPFTFLLSIDGSSYLHKLLRRSSWAYIVSLAYLDEQLGSAGKKDPKFEHFVCT